MGVITNGVGMWTKLGVEYLDLTEQLSREAAWTHTEALLYSNRKGFDLAIPKDHLAKLPHPPESWVIEELFEAEVWADDGATVNIGLVYPEWQVPREVVKRRREQAAIRQDRKRHHDVGDHSLCTERCAHVTRDHPGDGSRDAPSYPDRYGSARSGTDLTSKDSHEGKEPLETQDERLGAASSRRSGPCAHCHRVSAFLDGGFCRRDECQAARLGGGTALAAVRDTAS